MTRRCFSISRRIRARSGEARSSRVPSGAILLRKERRNSVKSTTAEESCAAAVHSDFMAAGGLSAICRHSAARSTSRITSRISVVSRAAPAMRDSSRSVVMSSRAEKSKLPPARRNSRISVVSWCWVSIQAGSVVGARAEIRCWPSGEAAYPRSRSRSESNSSSCALVLSIRPRTYLCYPMRSLAVVARGRGP